MEGPWNSESLKIADTAKGKTPGAIAVEISGFILFATKNQRTSPIGV
jgi:hypothetical protein